VVADLVAPESAEQPWRASRWRRQGYDRLYVHADSGASIGWYDLDSGALHAVEAHLTRPLTEFVSRWLDSDEARALGPLPAPHPPAHTQQVRPRAGRRPR
jgi:hypothetical protein